MKLVIMETKLLSLDEKYLKTSRNDSKDQITVPVECGMFCLLKIAGRYELILLAVEFSCEKNITHFFYELQSTFWKVYRDSKQVLISKRNEKFPTNL